MDIIGVENGAIYNFRNTFFIFLILSILIFVEDKNKKNSSKSNKNCLEYINQMLAHYGYDYSKVSINTKKLYQYNVRENSIGIINLESNKLSDIIASLHEVGHYVVINKTTQNYKLFKCSQYIIAINRIFIMPIILILMCIKIIFNNRIILIPDNLKYIFIIIFIIATLLRIFVGISNEIMASKKASEFIKFNNDSEILTLSKKIYKYSLYNQIFMCILFTILELFIFINI